MKSGSYTKEDFRDYIASLEKYYSEEFNRLKGAKPFEAEAERRMMLLCGHTLSNFDRIDV